jgi:hypothetical protein
MNEKTAAAIRTAAENIKTAMGLRNNTHYPKKVYMDQADKLADEILRLLDEEENNFCHVLVSDLGDLSCDKCGNDLINPYDGDYCPGCGRKIEPCHTCHGGRSDPNDYNTPCPDCRGSGKEAP